MSPRFLIVAPLAVVITVGLFFLMRDLIATSPEKPDEVAGETFQLTPDLPEEKSTPIDRTPPPPIEEPEAQAPSPDHEAVLRSIPIDPTIKGPDGPPIPGGGAGGPPVFKHLDGTATPMVRGKPQYPPCGRGIGEVVLDFVVEPDGSVSDVKVVDATSSCFARAAERATRGWRYKPEVVGGEAVRSGRQRVRIQFVEDQ